MINELEYIDGEVYANVYQTDCIARIDPDTGIVKGWILLGDILKRVDKSVHDVEPCIEFAIICTL